MRETKRLPLSLKDESPEDEVGHRFVPVTQPLLSRLPQENNFPEN